MKDKSFINISLDFKAVALKRTISLEPAKFYFCCSSVVGLLAVPTVSFVFCLSENRIHCLEPDFT
jgi:hypothetical protein